MTTQERAALEQEIPEIVRLLRHVRVLDCGAHYCRYCPAKSPAWEHTASCPYEESQRIHTEAQALIPRLASLLTPSSPEQGEERVRLECDLREADARILHLEAAMTGVIEAYGDSGWAKSEMCRRLRAALASSPSVDGEENTR